MTKGRVPFFNFNMLWCPVKSLRCYKCTIYLLIDVPQFYRNNFKNCNHRDQQFSTLGCLNVLRGNQTPRPPVEDTLGVPVSSVSPALLWSLAVGPSWHAALVPVSSVPLLSCGQAWLAWPGWHAPPVPESSVSPALLCSPAVGPGRHAPPVPESSRPQCPPLFCGPPRSGPAGMLRLSLSPRPPLFCVPRRSGPAGMLPLSLSPQCPPLFCGPRQSGPAGMLRLSLSPRDLSVPRSSVVPRGRARLACSACPSVLSVPRSSVVPGSRARLACSACPWVLSVPRSSVVPRGRAGWPAPPVPESSVSPALLWSPAVGPGWHALCPWGRCCLPR